MKLALVHDYLNQEGGAERVVEVLCRMYPDSPLYTSVYDRNVMLPFWQGVDVRTSYLQRISPSLRLAKGYLPLYPMAFENFDLRAYDVVVSSSSTFAKGVITGPRTLHICYCHSAARYAWMYHDYTEQMTHRRLARAVLPALISPLRVWDLAAAQRVDLFVANSETTARRIQKFYRREARVVHPPVEIASFHPSNHVEPYYLVVARLLPYKRIDLAVEACNRLRLPLVIVGDGPDMGRLSRLAGPTIEFKGRLEAERVQEHFARCRALLFPGEEDFGIAPVEALASGRPVIAYGVGGALETLSEGTTGTFFHEQTVEALIDALQRFDPALYNPSVLVQQARRFDRATFTKTFSALVEEAWQTADRPG